METLYEGHIGMVKMKGLSRGFVWWPNIDKDIEGAVRNCEGCRELANNPAHAPLHRLEYPSLPWQRFHIDIGEPVQGKMLMVVIDAHSKWQVLKLECRRELKHKRTRRSHERKIERRGREKRK